MSEHDPCATYSPAVIARLVRMMCPDKVCRVCGEPSRRVVETEPGMGGYHQAYDGGSRTAVGTRHTATRQASTLGWSDCGHDDWRNGVVLDPFGGSGTTGAVATGHGRDCVMIDIDSRNADLAVQRCGMWLTVEHHDVPDVVA